MYEILMLIFVNDIILEDACSHHGRTQFNCVCVNE
jgi:hypothetical protein